MSTQVKRILVVIPEKMLREELHWFQEDMGEYAVRTYLIKKPEVIAEKGENVNQILTESEKRFIEDYRMLIKEIGKKERPSFTQALEKCLRKVLGHE